MTDAPNVEERQIPQEEVHGCVQLGLHQDGGQEAQVTTHSGYIGQEKDSEEDGFQFLMLC